jgi:hypothetical protein
MNQYTDQQLETELKKRKATAREESVAKTKENIKDLAAIPPAAASGFANFLVEAGKQLQKLGHDFRHG